jgi:hypothetical protein
MKSYADTVMEVLGRMFPMFAVTSMFFAFAEVAGVDGIGRRAIFIGCAYRRAGL